MCNFSVYHKSGNCKVLRLSKNKLVNGWTLFIAKYLSLWQCAIYFFSSFFLGYYPGVENQNSNGSEELKQVKTNLFKFFFGTETKLIFQNKKEPELKYVLKIEELKVGTKKNQNIFQSKEL